MISRIFILRGHPRNISLIHILFQIILALRNQVQQGNMTQQQALERLAMMQASAHSFQEQGVHQQLPPGFNAGAMPSGTTQQQIAALSQRVAANNQINTLQRAIQAQDPSHARQFNILLPGQQQQQQQQQQPGTRFTPTKFHSTFPFSPPCESSAFFNPFGIANPPTGSSTGVWSSW
jgi:hypothetical protein